MKAKRFRRIIGLVLRFACALQSSLHSSAYSAGLIKTKRELSGSTGFFLLLLRARFFFEQLPINFTCTPQRRGGETHEECSIQFNLHRAREFCSDVMGRREKRAREEISCLNMLARDCWFFLLNFFFFIVFSLFFLESLTLVGYGAEARALDLCDRICCAAVEC